MLLMSAQVCVVASVTVCGGGAAQTERDPATTRDHDRGSSTTTTTTASAEAARLALMTTIVCVCVCVFHMNTQNETCGSNTVCAHTGEAINGFCGAFFRARVSCFRCASALLKLTRRHAATLHSFLWSRQRCAASARDGILCVRVSVCVFVFSFVWHGFSSSTRGESPRWRRFCSVRAPRACPSIVKATFVRSDKEEGTNIYLHIHSQHFLDCVTTRSGDPVGFWSLAVCLVGPMQCVGCWIHWWLTINEWTRVFCGISLRFSRINWLGTFACVLAYVRVVLFAILLRHYMLRGRWGAFLVKWTRL